MYQAAKVFAVKAQKWLALCMCWGLLFWALDSNNGKQQWYMHVHIRKLSKMMISCLHLDTEQARSQHMYYYLQMSGLAGSCTWLQILRKEWSPHVSEDRLKQSYWIALSKRACCCFAQMHWNLTLIAMLSLQWWHALLHASFVWATTHRWIKSDTHKTRLSKQDEIAIYPDHTTRHPYCYLPVKLMAHLSSQGFSVVSPSQNK